MKKLKLMALIVYWIKNYWRDKVLTKLKNLIIKIVTQEIFYVGSADKLPPPLSKEEEVLYVTKSMEGDEFARAKLIEHNLRLVVFLAKKYENTKIDLEDFKIDDISSEYCTFKAIDKNGTFIVKDQFYRMIAS